MIKHIDDIDEFIEYTKELYETDKYVNIQIDIGNNKYDKEFTEYLVNIAEQVRCDELKSFARQSTDIPVNEIIEKITEENSLKAGIKVIHKPLMKIHDYHLWEDGYIEGFIRICPKGEPDYFIWTYIRMNHLKDILNKYKDKLIFYDYTTRY